MDDVTRLFRFLVRHLAHEMPERLNGPIEIAELYQSLVPYRRFKRELQFDSIEDYEMALLKLLAGTGGYATVDPPDAQEALSVEAEAIAPDPGAFRAFAAARVTLRPASVRLVLNEDSAFAPPELRAAAPPPTLAAQPPRAAPPAARPALPPRPRAVEPPPAPPRNAPRLVFEPVATGEQCRACRAELPEGRKANFCPYCGHRIEPGSCPHCGDPVEPGWRFCPTCGRPTTG
jgi:hypothetical protein